MEVGNIVYLKNICFGDGTADHACLVGRPCVYIGELDERMYFIPLVSIHKDKYKSETRIYPTKKNKLQKVSHPNVRVLIEKPIAFYVNCGTLMKEDIHNTFKDIMKYYKFVLDDKSGKAVSLAINYFKKEGKYVDDALVAPNKALGLVK